jgi:hypothetical protein
LVSPTRAPALLTARELNRATLARQWLLDRADSPVVPAIDQLAGLQAQWSTSPYVALWTRLRGFQIEHLERALRERRVVKATLMRGTLHLVSAREFPLYVAATRDPRHAAWTAEARRCGVDTELLRQEVIGFAADEPRTREQILDLLADRAPQAEGSRWQRWRIVGEYGDLVLVPPSGLWRTWGGGRYAAARHWLPDFSTADPAEAYIHLVRRYLGAFGPASRADIAGWSGQPVRRLAPALEALAPELRTFTDERGRTLYDLAGAPRPPAGGRAPVRFLPRWDNLLLAHADRTRVLPERFRKTVIRVNGDVLPTFLVEGVVAGAWEVTRQRNEAVLRLSPFEALEPADHRALEDEGERLLRFVEPDAAGYAVRVAGVA